jgi:hypothetical protein
MAGSSPAMTKKQSRCAGATDHPQHQSGFT